MLNQVEDLVDRYGFESVIDMLKEICLERIETYSEGKKDFVVKSWAEEYKHRLEILSMIA